MELDLRVKDCCIVHIEVRLTNSPSSTFIFRFKRSSLLYVHIKLCSENYINTAMNSL